MQLQYLPEACQYFESVGVGKRLTSKRTKDEKGRLVVGKASPKREAAQDESSNNEGDS